LSNEPLHRHIKETRQAKKTVLFLSRKKQTIFFLCFAIKGTSFFTQARDKTKEKSEIKLPAETKLTFWVPVKKNKRQNKRSTKKLCCEIATSVVFFSSSPLIVHGIAS